jgi:galactose mutarotase-like enzyme
MDYTIHNEKLTVKIKSKGAELFSVFHHDHKLEYMWSGDPAFWGKTSPVLFPIVGSLKSNTYYVNDKTYSLTRHGFARDAEFLVELQQTDRITFLLISNSESLQNFPFAFELRITYTVSGSALHVNYEVRNPGKDNMLFSLGAHPAFKVPLTSGSGYEDHYLEFSETENAPRWPISKDGLIEKAPQPLLLNSNTLPLSKKLFENDALVLKNLRSRKVLLKATSHPHGLEFGFEGFPFLGIWAAKHADFVCIEPWCGIADSVDHDQQLKGKEGIEKLVAGEAWSRTWHARFF